MQIMALKSGYHGKNDKSVVVNKLLKYKESSFYHAFCLLILSNNKLKR